MYCSCCFVAMATKRKRIVLSVFDKIKIINQLKNGARGSSLAREYGVGNATISDIKKNSDAIIKFSSILDSEDGSVYRKTMKMAENQDLDTAVYMWYVQVRNQGQPITGPLICKKALEINKKLGGNDDFKATNGWLMRFKSRHGIRHFNIRGEKLSADTEIAEQLKEFFKNMIDQKVYKKANIYNADETGLYWKKMPTKSVISKNEMSAPGFKASKSRVTVMVCGNATGTHRLPLLIIGKSKNPRCFKGIKQLPVIYKNQKNSWMDTSIFIEWYDTVFIPEVKKHQLTTGNSGNVLLLIDSAQSHPSNISLERENGKFKVVFLPPNIASVLQPMDQGVIESFKRYYRKALLHMVLIGEEYEKTIRQVYTKINLKDAMYMAAEAWATVKDTTLATAWNKLLPSYGSIIAPEEPPNSQFVSQLFGLIKERSGFEECDEENIQDWLKCDVDDRGYQVFSDDEIVASIIDNQQEPSDDEEEPSDDEEEPSDDEEEPCDNDHAEKCPSSEEAFHCLETAIKWLEQQEECDAVQLLLSLKRVRDLAARKRDSATKQKTILDFYPKL
ncbi:jerky protein homolog-like [Centruroides sculpturatus]|uniref:jerky protein homolog-like n=1 Tax=Centruroides sculpturatus TaxID=218467 RepID=UPI000C6E0AEC|nr:jerky protein homolog-like [Centruroides sculpturatus]XP_023231583.1 jerky protein homolog-like [Centruroides sculpturatus]